MLFWDPVPNVSFTLFTGKVDFGRFLPDHIKIVSSSVVEVWGRISLSISIPGVVISGKMHH